MSSIHWISEHHFSEIRQPRQELVRADRCIYCSASTSYLGAEHVWPDGLNGHLIVPRASCRLCEDRINRFEQSVVKINLGLARDAHGIHSAKRRRGFIRPKTLRATREGAPDLDLPFEINMPQAIIVEAPGRRASIITGVEFGSQDLVPIVVATNPDAHFPPGYSVSIKKFRTGNFPRFLAKVAHSYATGILGFGAFQPALLGLIRGEGPPSHSRFLGDLQRLRAPLSLNVLRLGVYEGSVFFQPGMPPSDGKLVIVTVDIFTVLHLPTFEVVVGVPE